MYKRQELERDCTGAKIEKIYQPDRDELILLLRGNRRLLLSANAGSCRVQLTTAASPNPPSPPMFCMLMRKHLTGGKLLSFEQPSCDRILRIRVSAENELGERCVFTLVAECMGKYLSLIHI